MNLLKNFAAMYDDDIETEIFDGLGEVPAAWKEYFNVEPTAKYINPKTLYSGMGSVPEWKDGAPIPMDNPLKIGDGTITQVFYGMAIAAARKLVQYGEIAKIKRWAKSLGRSLGQTYGMTHADVLNDAFTTTYAIMGTVALISASHTASGSATRSNILASTALTPSALETPIVQGMNAVNHRGLNDPIIYNKLITVPSLRRTATKILNSEGEPGTADNDINTQRGMFALLIEPFASDSTTHWFLQAATHGLMSMHGMAPTPDEWMSRSSKSRIYSIEADFAVGVDFFEGMAGSQGA